MADGTGDPVSAPTAGTYVLASSVFYRNEGEGDEVVRRRYKRGDKVKLSRTEAKRLAVPSRLAPAAFVKASDDDLVVVGDDLVTSPPLVVNRESEANQIVAEANTGITVPAHGPILTPEQLQSEVTTPAVTGAGAGDTVPTPIGSVSTPAPPTTSEGKPAKSATPEVWKAYAVKVGAVTENSDLTKAQLQKAVADHEAKTAGQQ